MEFLPEGVRRGKRACAGTGGMDAAGLPVGGQRGKTWECAEGKLSERLRCEK